MDTVLNAATIESVGLTELKVILDRNLVPNSVVGSVKSNGNLTETRTVMIGPATAEALLTRNLNNRPVNKGNVEKLVKAMKEGEWMFDGTPITFDKYGNLMNGQHRLTAIVKSGKTIMFNVSSGYPSEIFATMDIGKVRTGSDVLAIAGIPNHKLVAKSANFIYKFVQGSIGESAMRPATQSNIPSTGLSHPELLAFVKMKPEIQDGVEYFLGIQKRQTMTLINSYMVSGLYFLFAEKSEKDAIDFFDKLLIGKNLDDDSPIFHLRNRLINAKSGDKAKGMNHSEIVMMTVMAWNKFRNGERVKALKIPKVLPTII